MTTIRAADLQVGDIIETPKGDMIVVMATAPPTRWRGQPQRRGYILAMGWRANDGQTATLPGMMDDDEPMTIKPGFGCPRCLLVSHNPKDIEARHCGHCHIFWPRFPRDMPTEFWIG